MIITLCHMDFHCQTSLTSSMAMLINRVLFHVGFSTKACHGFGRPQTWELNIYICVGTSLIGGLDDDNHTLPHGFSVPDKSNRGSIPKLKCKIKKRRLAVDLKKVLRQLRDT